METTVGIDVSKDRLDVHVLPSGEAFSVSNDHAGMEELAGRLAALSPTAIGLEATGGYEQLAVATLADAGLAVVVVNPAQVRAYANALGKRAKTDAIDAAVIAAFIAATKPELRPDVSRSRHTPAPDRADDRGRREPRPHDRRKTGAKEHQAPARRAQA